jgi:hypothetical protein
MHESEPNLKVTDRRHFTADGDLRSDAAAAPADPRFAPPESSPEAESAPPVTFTSFIVSLASQAADFIGGEHKDLGAARQMISAIEMLQDKSEGRRTEDETRIIQAVLFDLRMAFVGAAKGSTS